MPADIIVKVKDGRISIDVLGVSDASCQELTRCLQEALGTVESVDEKPQEFVELIDQHVYEN